MYAGIWKLYARIHYDKSLKWQKVVIKWDPHISVNFQYIRPHFAYYIQPNSWKVSFPPTILDKNEQVSNCAYSAFKRRRPQGTVNVNGCLKATTQKAADWGTQSPLNNSESLMEIRSNVSSVEEQPFLATRYSARYSRASESNTVKGKKYFNGAHALLGAFLAWSSQLPDSCCHCEETERAKERNQYLNLKQPERSMRGARINWFVYVFGLSKAPSLKKREDILSKRLIRNHTASVS